ncbi:hypothetical protein [Xenorhabdus ehlersii]|uniref:DUF2867 domain-containing protein n=1 Tax=Xenorhabdus ehlersii TaxID=290111 RepID=A0A2D0ISA9_9GAMM|nr:hypothetical protein [Xenorhabdus ehlersii]PHM24734.1 hypothetical protein Xehl_01986 [Xenorhabdus ehlersii]RKE91369.1 hypothetical protein BDE27_1591 [Xenorhabdus ehlersii]
MTFLGIVNSKEYKTWKHPTPFLPYFHFHEIHESESIKIPAKEIIQAVKDFEMTDDLFIKTLSKIRNMPTYLINKLGRKNNNQEFGLKTFTPLNENSHEISMGLTGRFWQMDLGIIHQADLESFINFDDHKSAKLVLRFLVREHLNGYHSLVTETFIFCPNDNVKKKFTFYWFIIRPASGFIRKRALSVIIKKLKNKHT